MSFQQIKSSIEAGRLQPVYFFTGEETWAIDTLTDLIIDRALTDAERDFNQHIFYGKDSQPQDVLNVARRYPVFAERQLVVVRESQHWKGYEAFEAYFRQPVETTVLVFNHKYKALDLRTAINKLIKKETVFLKSDKLRDYEVPKWITEYVKNSGKSIDAKSVALIHDHLGNDLPRISNEIDKLLINLPESSQKIQPHHIEEYIGISKDYNAFELAGSLATREYARAMRIVQYFGQNPKAGPFPLVMTVIFNFFCNLYQLQASPGLSDTEASRLLKVNPYFVKDYKTALKHYTPARTEDILGHIALYDARSKGIGNTGNVSEYELLKELLYRIMR